MQPSPFLFGWIALGLMYVLSIVITRSGWPWALARGHNNSVSASLLQFWVFTIVTVFAYVTAFFARVLEPKAQGALTLPDVPVNLLILMGLSVVTASSSKGIVVSYLRQNQVTSSDESNAVSDREGATDLSKVQMLIWTFVAATIYLIRFGQFIATQEYLPKELGQGFALPDIDGALLVLMGAADGGYIGGKLVSRTTAAPVIERFVPPKVSHDGDEVVIEGNLFGDAQAASRLTLDDVTVGAGDIVSWTDTEIKIKLPAGMTPAAGQPAKKVKGVVRVNSRNSDAKDLLVGI